MTAAIEGFIDSHPVVASPLGRGLRRTTFVWEIPDRRLGAVDGEPCSPASV